MVLSINVSRLESIKKSLRKANPETRPTLRLEALAKSLGFFTYASLLAALKAGNLSVRVNENAYLSHLYSSTVKDATKLERIVSRAITRAMLQEVMSEHPELTLRGFDSIWQGTDDERKKTKSEREMLFKERRLEALEGDWAADQFELALIFLSKQNKIKSLNRKIGSYGLKHGAENLSRVFGIRTELGDYVSNGALIAAAYASGFEVKRVDMESYNANVNISMNTVNISRGWQKYTKERNTAIVRSLYELQ